MMETTGLLTCGKKTMEILHSVVLLTMLVGLIATRAESNTDDSAVSVQWPLSDTSAAVGRLFQYHIPADTFKGPVTTYQIVEQNKGILPDWLHYNEKTHVLSGIPMSKDKGQYVMDVTAFGRKTSQDKALDVFSIFVKDDQPHISSNKPLKSTGKTKAKPVNCIAGNPLTSVTVVVDADFDQFFAEDRLKFARKFAKHLNMAPEMLKFHPVAGRPTFDGSALVAGPGNAKTTKYGGVFASWLVGCGNVETDHMPVLQKVEELAADGSMARDIEHPVIGWHVSNARTENPRKRNRRDAGATATPSMSMPLPTKVVETVMSTMDVTSMIKPSMTVDVQPSATQEKIVSITPPYIDKMTIKPSKVETTSTPSMMGTTEAIKCPDDGVDRPPHVNQGIPRVKSKVGQLTKVNIPRDAFMDCEDGNVDGLTVNAYGEAITDLPMWADFNTDDKVLLVFPLNTDAGVKKLVISAKDRSDNVVSLDLEVIIEGSDAAEETPSVEVVMTLDVDYDEFMSSFSNRVTLRRKIGRLIGDGSGRSITLTRVERGSTVVGWTINSLAKDTCEEEDIRNYLGQFLHKNVTLKAKAKKILRQYNVEKLDLVVGDACKDVDLGLDGIVIKPLTESTPEPKAEATPKPASGKDEEDGNIWVTTVVPAVVIVVILLIALLVACILYRKRRQGKMSPQDQHTFVNKGTPVIFQTDLAENSKDTAGQPLLLPEGDERRPHQSNPPDYNHSAGNHHHHPQTEEPERHEEFNETTDDEIALFRPPPQVTSSNETKAPKPAVQPGMSPPPIGP